MLFLQYFAFGKTIAVKLPSTIHSNGFRIPFCLYFNALKPSQSACPKNVPVRCVLGRPDSRLRGSKCTGKSQSRFSFSFLVIWSWNRFFCWWIPMNCGCDRSSAVEWVACSSMERTRFLNYFGSNVACGWRTEREQEAYSRRWSGEVIWLNLYVLMLLFFFFIFCCNNSSSTRM